MASDRQPWWRDGIVYQIYPRSFADSDADGVGDLRGVRARLDYLEWLGVDGIWLTPTFPSPNADWGYDVADYVSVHPDLGTLDDLDALVDDAGSRGIRVLLDLVPAHTSDRHPWFVEARSARNSPMRDRYIWRDEPTAQESTFGGRAWTYDEGSGQWYHHLFLPEQPDLNWANDDVRDAFDDILRFWFDRGIAGFRIDVAHEIVKDPPDRPDRPEIHRVLRRWRSIADAYEPPRVLVGETWVELDELASFYGDGTDELHLAFNFPFMLADLDARARAEVAASTNELLPTGAWPVWALSNHDVIRFPTRLCADDDARVKAALLFLLTLRGTPVLYNGDELGMRQVGIAADRALDVHGRDGARTPIPWGDAEWREPWLPLGENTRSVAEQRADPRSVLSFTRELIGLRRARHELRDGVYAELESAPGVWAWRRGDELAVAVNLTDGEAPLDAEGAVLLSTHGEAESGRLRAWEGVVLG
jgi:alpha-glucosidase